MNFVFRAIIFGIFSIGLLLTSGCSKDKAGGGGAVGVSPDTPRTADCRYDSYYHPDFGWLDGHGYPVDCDDDWWDSSHRQEIDFESYIFTGRTCYRGQNLGPDCYCELYFGSLNGYVYCRNQDKDKK